MAENGTDDIRYYTVEDAAGDTVAEIAMAPGYRLSPLIVDHGADVDRATIQLDAECTIEDHHPCDVKVALGVATDVAEAAGLASYGKLREITDRGVVSEAEAEAVLATWATEVQGSEVVTAEQRDWATVVTEELWPAENKGA